MKRLNLGSGVKPLRGYINIDSFPHPRTDIVGDCLTIGDLFEPETFDEIHSSHFLEHLWLTDLQQLLRTMHSLLKPGGRTVHEGPDAGKIARLYCSGKKDEDYLLRQLFGGEPERLHYGNQFVHRLGLTGTRVAALLLEAGFVDPVITDGRDHHQPERDWRVEARKPT